MALLTQYLTIYGGKWEIEALIAGAPSPCPDEFVATFEAHELPRALDWVAQKIGGPVTYRKVIQEEMAPRSYLDTLPQGFPDGYEYPEEEEDREDF